MKVFKIIAFIISNILYLSLNLTLCFFYYRWIFNDGLNFHIYLDSFDGLLVLFGCIVFLWAFKIMLFPIVLTFLAKTRYSKALNKLENNLDLQNRLLKYSFLFDVIVFLLISSYAIFASLILELYAPNVFTYLFIYFVIWVLCGGGVFTSYAGLILWLEAKKIKIF